MNSRYSRLDTVRMGLIGTFVIVAVVLSALTVSSLPFLASGASYRALFLDAGGLRTGNAVQVAGIDSGKVTDIEIDGDAVAVTFTVDNRIRLGSDTRVDISTETVLGTKNLTVSPGHGDRLSANDTIGVDHTTSPYQLTDALGDVTTQAEGIDTDQLAESMTVLTSTLQQTPESLRGALDGVRRLSETVSSRHDSLKNLLQKAEQVTGVLSTRSEQINTLIIDGNTVLGELSDRRAIIDELFDNVTRLATEVSGLIADNQAQLDPTLTSLRSVLGVLRQDKDSIALAIGRLGPYVTELGEAVGSGPFFNSYIQNLIPGQIISPFIRAALGLGPAPGENTTDNPISIVDGAPPR